jgi:VIT1/CCC1 family predicted Fe2+/Mn2+ transporter
LAASERILDPIERTTEVMFGVIMVLTFTTSISVVEGGEAENRTILLGALGCNLAWGIIDAVFYLLANFTQRARGLEILRAVRGAGADEAQRLLLDALPSPVAQVLTPHDIDSLRDRLRDQPEPPSRVAVEGRVLKGALGVFLLVFLSTFPVVIPFLVVQQPALALRTSNAVALVMLFVTGWSLGKYAGRPAWVVGLVTTGLGLVLVAIAIALGG